ncbi:hypothetical protein FACS1894152_6650 [Bacilli bacterium]|nr:hypothetical protein FACS1894152_6650 [Bacilli bacterium]
MKKYLLLLPILMCSCSTQKFVFDVSRSEPTASKTAHFFIGGIGQTESMNPEEICGKGNVAAVEAQYSVINVLLTGVTWGIYAPKTFNVYCKIPLFKPTY